MVNGFRFADDNEEIPHIHEVSSAGRSWRLIALPMHEPFSVPVIE